MRVLVFEQWHGGHYFNYLELLLPRLSELADEVAVTITARALHSHEFVAKLGACRALANVKFEASVPEAQYSLPVQERLMLLKHLRDAVKRVKPDYILVPSADAQTLALGALGHLGFAPLPKNIPSEATFHLGYGPAIDSVKHLMKEAVYRFAFSGCTWTRLNFVNFLYYEYALRQHCRWIERARMVPDPVPVVHRLSREEARRLLGVPQDGRYLGLLGSLDKRKAVPELLGAFRVAALGHTDRLLLAGRLTPQFRELIAAEYGDLLRSGRIVLIDRFLTEAEVTQGYSALDLVLATYTNFPGLASLMLKGVAAGRPVVANDFGWPRALIKRFGLGSVCDINDRNGFAYTLSHALDASADYAELEGTKRLLAFHETSNFVETMLDNVRCITGKPARHPLKTWDWVLEAVDPEYRHLY